MVASPPPLQNKVDDSKDLSTSCGTSVDAENTGSKTHRARRKRAEILATVEAALGTLQHVEHIFSLVPTPASPEVTVATSEVVPTEDDEDTFY